MSDMLARFPFEELRALAIVPAIPSVLYAMMTIFQYAEGIADQQAASGVCTRLDWKYALQLPLTYTGFDPQGLCEFRVGVRQNPLAQKGLERLIVYLADQGLMSRKERVTCALEVVRSVCILNRLETILTAMSECLETLALNEPDWLQATMNAHWVERYPWSTKNSLPIAWEKQELLACMIAEDASYLLAAIEQQHKPTLSSLLEIENLRQITLSQFTHDEAGRHWFPKDCPRYEGFLCQE